MAMEKTKNVKTNEVKKENSKKMIQYLIDNFDFGLCSVQFGQHKENKNDFLADISLMFQLNEEQMEKVLDFVNTEITPEDKITLHDALNSD